MLFFCILNKYFGHVHQALLTLFFLLLLTLVVTWIIIIFQLGSFWILIVLGLENLETLVESYTLLTVIFILKKDKYLTVRQA